VNIDPDVVHENSSFLFPRSLRFRELLSCYLTPFCPSHSTPNTLVNAYLYGAGEIVENVTTKLFFFQDNAGNTSHLSDEAGNLKEFYTYSGFGEPKFYSPTGTPSSASTQGTKHLFQGELWIQAAGLTDHRNRHALPTMGVFLQPDPIGFGGDPTNLYRYCANNPVNHTDPSGLWTFQIGPSVTFQWGVFAYNGGFGIAFDGHGNIGGYVTNLFGGGGGGDASGGLSFTASNADNIYELRDWFTQISAEAGSGWSGSVEAFHGKVNGKSITGLGVTIGGGVGGGGYGGASFTTITPLWSPSSTAVPAPGGTTFVDPTGCGPDCVTTERVTVTSTYLPNYVPTYLYTGVTYFKGDGSRFHVGTTGNIINGSAFTVTNAFPGLTSAGGGDWVTVRPGGNFGGQPGEGSHPVGFELE
jgi:RHS repeat-associated protein